MTDFLKTYEAHVAERAELGIPPLPLSAVQTADVIELIKNPPAGHGDDLVTLLTYRVPPGVDDAAETVVDAVEIAADRQAASGAAIGQHGRRRHEPEF